MKPLANLRAAPEEARAILFHGALRSENFGDVLLAQVILSWIREATAAQIFAAGVSESVLKLLGLKKATLQDQFTADAFILSGGAFFNFPGKGAPFSEAARFFVRNSWPLLSAQALGKPTAIIGVGALGGRPLLWRTVARLSFSRTRAASVRDSGSWKALRELGVKQLPACTADSVFYLTLDDLPQPALRYADGVVLKAAKGRRIGVHLSGSPETSPHYARLFQILEARIAPDPNLTIFVIEDHPSSKSGQRAAQDYLSQRLGSGRCVAVPYPGTYELASVLAKLDAVLTDKLHVGLVAAAMGTPPFSVSKHPKNAPAYDEIGLGAHCLMLDSASDAEIDRLASALVASTERFKVPDHVRTGAQRNRELVHAFITEHFPRNG
jgi:polysaccharide pyruvyl transferase WcaK-like protein